MTFWYAIDSYPIYGRDVIITGKCKRKISFINKHIFLQLLCTIMGAWWRWALISLDGVAPSRMVGVSASVNLPLHHKVQRFSSGNGSLGWSRKKGCKMVVVVVYYMLYNGWLQCCVQVSVFPAGKA